MNAQAWPEKPYSFTWTTGVVPIGRELDDGTVIRDGLLYHPDETRVDGVTE